MYVYLPANKKGNNNKIKNTAAAKKRKQLYLEELCFKEKITISNKEWMVYTCIFGTDKISR